MTQFAIYDHNGNFMFNREALSQEESLAKAKAETPSATTAIEISEVERER
jgi:hypothetical protein